MRLDQLLLKAVQHSAEILQLHFRHGFRIYLLEQRVRVVADHREYNAAGVVRKRNHRAFYVAVFACLTGRVRRGIGPVVPSGRVIVELHAEILEYDAEEIHAEIAREHVEIVFHVDPAAVFAAGDGRVLVEILLFLFTVFEHDDLADALQLFQYFRGGLFVYFLLADRRVFHEYREDPVQQAAGGF